MIGNLISLVVTALLRVLCHDASYTSQRGHSFTGDLRSTRPPNIRSISKELWVLEPRIAGKLFLQFCSTTYCNIAKPRNKFLHIAHLYKCKRLLNTNFRTFCCGKEIVTSHCWVAFWLVLGAQCNIWLLLETKMSKGI